MDARELIDYISRAEKKTPVKLYVNTREAVNFGAAKIFGSGNSFLVFGDWEELAPVLRANAGKIRDVVIESDRRNSAVPLLDLKGLHARVEPGALIREGVEIGEGAVILMGAVLNAGARIGRGTMVDMGAVIGSRAVVGERCHIGAGAVLAGVLEPPSAVPVTVEDGALVGANAVVLEGIRVGRNAVVAAGAVVCADVPENAVAAGNPARIVKVRDTGTDEKTVIVEDLRKL